MNTNLRVICLLSVLLGLSGCIFFYDVEPPTAKPTDQTPDADVGYDTGDTDAADTNGPGDNNDPDTGDAPDTSEPPVECTCELPENAVATCTAEAPGECTFACEDGFVSLEGDAAAGCGCALVDGEDVPGDGVDNDCDGFDGVLARSVFVAPGSDGDGLSPEAPMGSLAAALKLAREEGRTYILVAAGTYPENLTLEAGIHLYGGYAADGWARDVEANEVILVGRPDAPERPTVLASGLDAPTRLDGLTIKGPNLATGERTGATSYGVLVVDSGDMLAIVGSTIVGGVGDDGAHGAHGEKGADGPNGADGSGRFAGGAQDSTCGAMGGDGGTAQPCNEDSGASGRSGQPRPAGSESATSPGIGGAAGIAGVQACKCLDGVSASDGGAGSAGQSGRNGTEGQVAESPVGTFDATGGWSPAPGAAATDGQNGGGGGGGGAGGSSRSLSSGLCGNPVTGGGGGAGGGGGCGGIAGQNGQPGGSAFALVLVNSTVHLTDSQIQLGASGNGGDGGNGSPGGERGTGGAGQTAATGGKRGGRGGDGGDGGMGAPGAGGCGGLVVGVALVGESAADGLEATEIVEPETAAVGEGGASGRWPGHEAPFTDATCDGSLMHTAQWALE